MSFTQRLARLAASGPQVVQPGHARQPPPADEAAQAAHLEVGQAARLEELRTKMQAILERTTRKSPPRELDAPELPFVTMHTERGPLHVRRLQLSASHRTGRAPIHLARHARPELLACLALDPSLAACDPARALYLDTETTGLQGGTGTVAFLVGLALWTEEGLLVEQILVRALGEEAPMLEHVASRLRQASMVITFNGKSFDLPLLRTRFVLARVTPPAELPHLDLVHVARRVHGGRSRANGHKLTTIERDVLGFVRHDDVASGDVSACYLHFLRTGDTRSLLGVVEHNAWDVVAMAALVGLYGEPFDEGALEAADLAGVARTLRRARRADWAMDIANLAVERGGGEAGLRARAEIAKARGDRARALADFTALAASVDDPSVRLELAKLYEHFVKEPARALALALEGTGEKAEAAARRQARLGKKVAGKPR